MRRHDYSGGDGGSGSMSGDEREHGRIVSVSTRTLGSPLEGDVAAGATELVVFDAADFNGTGGSLSLNGTVLTYASVDDDASTITLDAPLAVAASDGDFVSAWDTLYNRASTEQTAMVQLDGDDDNPDPIEAGTEFLSRLLPDGDRGGPGESVTLEYDEDEDEWQIRSLSGLHEQAGEKHCDTDTFTVTATGDQTIPLSHTPSPGSLDVKWHPDGGLGLPLVSSQWSVDGSTLTVPDPNGLIAVGDLIDPQYDYRDGPITPSIPTTLTPVAGAAGYEGTYSSLPVPAGASVGDFVVLGGMGLTVNDPRLTLVDTTYSRVWAGILTDLTDLGVSVPGTTVTAYSIAVFAGGHTVGEVQTVQDTTNPDAIPVVTGSAAIACITSSYNVTDGWADALNGDYGWVDGTNPGTGKDNSRIAYWQNETANQSPSTTTVHFSPNSFGHTITVFGVS